jgi:hypothetical protein
MFRDVSSRFKSIRDQLFQDKFFKSVYMVIFQVCDVSRHFKSFQVDSRQGETTTTGKRGFSK